MSISDLGALGSFFAAIAVFVTLIYLARQVRQGNMVHRMQSRESLMNQDLVAIQLQLADLDLTKVFFKENPTRDDLLKLQLFLVHFLRQREWEWLLHKDGILPDDVYRTYVDVIHLFFSSERTKNWWNFVGKTAINSDFADEIDRIIESRPPTDYWHRVAEFLETGSRSG